MSKLKGFLNKFLSLIPTRFRNYLLNYYLIQEENPKFPKYMIIGAYKKIRIDKDIEGFSDIANTIQKEKRTLLGFDRLYTIWQCIKYLPKDSNILEVGVYRGGSTKFLALTSQWFSKKCQITAVDTFSGHAEVDPSVDGEHQVHTDFSDVKINEVRDYLVQYNEINIEVGNIRDVSVNLGSKRDLGLVHIDVDVYPATLFSLEYAYNRLVSGGFIIIDDYGFTTCKGAKKAVDEFVINHPDIYVIHLLTGQALIFENKSKKN